ncbi:phytochrome-like protein cph1 [mine drainage metagenome]|uniref:histidine kinase n=1 Tax=mine drainage metagenome TaxID=410659 RepID=A0A1J5RT15_9ZZZZ
MSTSFGGATARKIVYLDGGDSNAEDVYETLRKGAVGSEVVRIARVEDYRAALESSGVDLIVADDPMPGLPGLSARDLAWQRCPDVPFLCVSDTVTPERIAAARDAGAADLVDRRNLPHLLAAVKCSLNLMVMERRIRRRARLVSAIQELSLVRTLGEIQVIVRRAARELTGADGATFVLRDSGYCFYADEDAISPLWKGKRFPMSACISGWTMMNRQSVIIEDIYADSRIPAEAYRPTFVQSLLMVPIRTEAPIGAIGNYWATSHRATPEEADLLQALANTTSVAMENVRVYEELEQRVKDRTVQLEATNRELEAFSYSVSHDLRSPLTVVRGYSEILLSVLGDTAEPGVRRYLEQLVAGSKQMCEIIDDLLRLALVAKTELHVQEIDLSREAGEILSKKQATDADRQTECVIEPGVTAQGDPGLVRVVLENLLSNAWKYSSRTAAARIEFGRQASTDGSCVFFVRDNGAGFDMEKAASLFAPFHRLHDQKEFAGTGVGLATVQRVISRHGGKIWAEAAVGKGATFFFTLPGSKPKE